MNFKLLALKAKLCGFESVSRTLRKRVSTSVGMKRHLLRQEKLYFGKFYTREHLIAYGLLRGISYRKIERTCGKHNRPNIAYIHQIIQEHGTWEECRKFTIEHVKELLKCESSQ